MIIVQLTGGMGNQMFQYAFGKYLALAHGSTLKLDLSFFETYEWHAYSLGPLTIDERIATSFDSKWLTGKFRSRAMLLVYNLKSRFAKSKTIVEPDLRYDPTFKNLPDNVYLDGYWQCEKYFIEISDIIRKEFTIKLPPSLENKVLLDSIVRHPAAVSLHIRRGNYVNVPEVNREHGVCSLSYYEDAVKAVNSKIKDPCFFIFSDDIEWAKDNLRVDRDVIFVDKNDDKSDYEDMRLMSSCRHNIIANSTFSWWAAWLNNNSNKIVIAPRKWFADTSKRHTDILPEGWVKL